MFDTFTVFRAQMNFKKNNLGNSASPYMRQHEDNPVWWQEWNNEVLDYARRNNKIIFASVGYSTCHWCHVMASEAFSDKNIAHYLNENFVSVKIDREQRPDIDQYLMSFVQSTMGQGGWPLNVFLTPDLKPIFGLTYAPIEPRYGLPGFIQILNQINDYCQQGGKIGTFKPLKSNILSSKEAEIIESLWNSYDKHNGGFGLHNKFPPHSTLLFMLYYLEATHDKKIRIMLEHTLDVILSKGLHDHLQGGFFRYCVDNEWTIPHFEKMLYDQAMLLWAYSLACRVLGRKEYRVAAEKIIKCLKETFEKDGIFFSGHNADTDHEEGKTYLWSAEDIKKYLNKDEYDKFTQLYIVSEEGNFESRNHLVKNKNTLLKEIEEKLLLIRKKRKQPFVDQKIITSCNCLLGIGMIHAYRYLNNNKALEVARTLFSNLIRKHYIDKKLRHSSLDNAVQKEEFLQDYSSMLLFITYLHEETNEYEDLLKEFCDKVLEFKKDGNWIESDNEDFIELSADPYDYSVPSSISLAELALLRADILTGKQYSEGEFKAALSHDFFNISTLVRNGFFHVIENPSKIGWDKIFPNSIQRKAEKPKECYKGICRDSIELT